MEGFIKLMNKTEHSRKLLDILEASEISNCNCPANRVKSIISLESCFNNAGFGLIGKNSLEL